MRNTSIFYLSILGWLLTSCNAIEGIFKTGMGLGAIIAIAVVVGIIILVNKMGGGRRGKQ